MSQEKNEIELLLNSAGFSGNDVEELLPDFITERYTKVGLTWYPSVDGPESFTLIITTSLLLAEFGKEFVKNLSKDLYEWSKGKIIPLLKKKNSPNGVIIVESANAQIYYHELTDLKENNENFSAFLKDLPKIITEVNPDIGKNWEVTFNEKTGFWTVEKTEYDANQIDEK
ncbi:MAG TPA: hypothetical protein PKY59_01595 [Pyrinomonadaceae bacterium]|nr:hypothetical protein [Pyrinomonadaceae bacterium]